MFHEIAPLQLDNSFQDRKPEKQDIVLCYHENGVLFLKDSETLRFPTMEEIGIGDSSNVRYGFAIDGEFYYILLDAIEDGVWEKISKSSIIVSYQDVRTMEPMYMGFASMIGKQLSRFFQSRQYCGCCGTKTEFSKNEQAIVCPSCKYTEYPKISPAIIVAVVNGNKLLMTKYAGGNYRKYALVAGFVEFGESFEEAVIREVKEEVGLNVKNVCYYKNQPWPFSDSQMVGFFAELDGDDQVTLQEDELSEAVWFTKDEIPYHNNSISISYELIEAVRRGEERLYFERNK